MTTPDAKPPLGVPRSLGAILVLTAAGALLVCLVLQIWRPFFFLTNDNLSQWLPPIVEIGRKMGTAPSPLVSASLFGGGYDWTTDVTIFPMISPFLPLLAPLARSEWYFSMIDVITTGSFLIIAMSFAGAAHWLRGRHALPLSDAAIVTASLSYAFAPLMLLFGSSWLGFINAQAAWPLAFVALQFSSTWRAVTLLVAAYAFSLFGGNLHPLSFLLLGSAAGALYFSVKGRSLRPILYLGASLILLMLLVWLVLEPGKEWAFSTGRVRAFSAEKSSALQINPPALFASLVAGPFARSLGGPELLFDAGVLWTAAVAYSLVNLPTIASLLRGGWRNPLSRPLLVAIVVLVLVIWRPAWLADLFAITPILRSTRWPFRETAVLIFLIHLLFVFNYRPLPQRWNRMVWSLALLPLVYLAMAGPPSFGTLELSRRLVISGAADAYWRQMRPSLGSHANVVSADLPSVYTNFESMPFPLLPSHNFAALFGVVSVSGYSTSSPLLLERARLLPPASSGIYSPDQARIYLEHFPQARLTILRQLNPPTWSILEDGRERRLTLDPATLAVRVEPAP